MGSRVNTRSAKSESSCSTWNTTSAKPTTSPTSIVTSSSGYRRSLRNVVKTSVILRQDNRGRMLDSQGLSARTDHERHPCGFEPHEPHWTLTARGRGLCCPGDQCSQTGKVP